MAKPKCFRRYIRKVASMKLLDDYTVEGTKVKGNRDPVTG